MTTAASFGGVNDPDATVPSSAVLVIMVPLARMKPLLVMNVVGLTPGLLRHTPRLAALGRAGFTAPLGTLLPAVTCPTQATMLTTGWPISSRRRASIGTGITECLHRITSSGGP